MRVCHDNIRTMQSRRSVRDSMTFEEAKLAKAERDVKRRAYEARLADKEKLADIIKKEVCCNIDCTDCTIRKYHRCNNWENNRGVENAAVHNMKEVVEWAGIEVPEDLQYLFDEKKRRDAFIEQKTTEAYR